MKIAPVFALLTLLQTALCSMYFYLEPKQTKCFYKELQQGSLLLVKYKVEASKDNGKTYMGDHESNLNLMFTTEEVFDNNHKVANQRGENGRFLFTALDSGDHRVCVTPVAAGGYALASKSKITIDIEVGDSSILERPDAEKVGSTLQLRNLYRRLENIKIDYLAFRGREAQFRDLSEAVNSNSVKWTIVQIIVLAGCCYLEMQTLKKFFIKQKVV